MRELSSARITSTPIYALNSCTFEVEYQCSQDRLSREDET